MDYAGANFGAYSEGQKLADDLDAASEGAAHARLIGLAPQNSGMIYAADKGTCEALAAMTGDAAQPIAAMNVCPEKEPNDGLGAFLKQKYSSPKDVWKRGLNQEYWRWGLVFSQGHCMNVTEERVRERLRTISGRLLRKIYGNHYRARGRVRFLGFQHGVAKQHNQHFHVLMAIEGEAHGWLDWRVALQVQSIDRLARTGAWNEKPVHIDFKWRNGNRYHSYTSRFLQFRNGTDVNWFVL